MDEYREAIYYVTHISLKIDLSNWEIIPLKQGEWKRSPTTILFFLCFKLIINRDIKYKK